MTAQPQWPHELYGGWLCLDFANTLDARAMPEHEENLHGYADLLRWAAYAGVVTDDEAARLTRRAARNPSAAQAALVDALEFREAIYRVFYAVATDRPVQQRDLNALQAAYAEAMQHATVVAGDQGYTWEWDDELSRLIRPIAESAISLLRDGALERIKVCASDEGCAGLFVDLSKNRSRRWCSMQSCGVESKVRAQNARRRAAHANN
jgi:predicted RNA-binding Zn ribbon-like protein